MKIKDGKNDIAVNMNGCKKIYDEELNEVSGHGNGDVRYIPDLWLQAMYFSLGGDV